MLLGLDHHVGSKLTDRRIATLLVPSLVFWTLVILADNQYRGGAILEALLKYLPTFIWEKSTGAEHKNSAENILLVLAILVVTGAFIRRLDFIILRILEGYWWDLVGLRQLRMGFVALQRLIVTRDEKKLQRLALADRSGTASPADKEKFAALDWKLRRVPSDPSKLMPTCLGNVLRAFELKPLIKYGLDPIICWPRFWLLLPDSVRQPLIDARASLDAHVSMITTGGLLCIFSLYYRMGWLGLAAGVVIIGSYMLGIQAAITYGALIESTFDTHRSLLYSAVRWSFPDTAHMEIERGKELTAYLYRGKIPDSVSSLTA